MLTAKLTAKGTDHGATRRISADRPFAKSPLNSAFVDVGGRRWIASRYFVNSRSRVQIPSLAPQQRAFGDSFQKLFVMLAVAFWRDDVNRRDRRPGRLRPCSARARNPPRPSDRVQEAIRATIRLMWYAACHRRCRFHRLPRADDLRNGYAPLPSGQWIRQSWPRWRDLWRESRARWPEYWPRGSTC
jgi:hypothetical protein